MYVCSLSHFSCNILKNIYIYVYIYIYIYIYIYTYIYIQYNGHVVMVNPFFFLVLSYCNLFRLHVKFSLHRFHAFFCFLSLYMYNDSNYIIYIYIYIYIYILYKYIHNNDLIAWPSLVLAVKHLCDEL